MNRLETTIITNNGKKLAFISFDNNEDIPEALEIFVRDIIANGWTDRIHDFHLTAINDKGFLDPGFIRAKWDAK